MASNASQPAEHYKFLPQRIILVRHGQSEGNLDQNIYTKVPDHSLELTPQGINQAQQAGTAIVNVLNSCSKRDWKAYFYVSPYTRTRSTLKEIARAFPKSSLVGVKEECRMREQDFGNFQNPAQMKLLKGLRGITMAGSIIAFLKENPVLMLMTVSAVNK